MKTLFALILAAPAIAGAAPLPHKADSVALVWSSGPYRYDAAGNIIAIGTNAYAYDPVGRLIDGTAHTPSYTNRQTFRYDPYGNLERIETTMQRAGATGIAAEVDQLAVSVATNRITDLSRCQAGVNCISGDYDAAGNQTSSSAGGAFDYDALGMMTRLRAGLKNEQYVYDADNERIATVAPSETRYTLRDLGGKVVREVTYSASTWSWQKDYVYRDGSLLAAITPTARQHFHLDHLGSPRLITDDAGFKLALHTYWPFGAEAPGSDSDTERMKFTGHERDFGTGRGLDLDYMHARFYEVAGGRFLSLDPIFGNPAAPQSWNRYAYVGNSPINATDPTGRLLVPLGQHTDREINKRQKEIGKQLKNKNLSAQHRTTLETERDTLAAEKDGNRIVGQWLRALGRKGQQNGLVLSNFTLTTNPAADFGCANAAAVQKALASDAFVMRGGPEYEGRIFIRTDNPQGIYQMSQQNPDNVYYGGSILRHEQVHLLGDPWDWTAFTVQQRVLSTFRRDFRNAAYYRDLDEWLQKQIDANQ